MTSSTGETLHVVVRRTPDQDPSVPTPQRVAAQRRGAREALAEAAVAAGCPDAIFEKASPRGAPLPTAGGWHWSITHDAALVAAAVWRHGPVGVDVEAIVLRRRLLVERVADAEERALLGESPPDRLLDAEGFARLWTAKEAVLKAERIGLPGLGDCRLEAVHGPGRTELSYKGAPRTAVHTRIAGQTVTACVIGEPPARILWLWSGQAP